MMGKDPLNYVKHDNGVAVVSINNDPLNRMSLAYIEMLEQVIEQIAADDEVFT